MSERRRAARIKLRHLSFVRPRDASLLTTEIVNISETGIALTSHEPLPDTGAVQLTCPGSSIQVEFELVHQVCRGEQFEAGAVLKVAASQQSRFRRYLQFVGRRTA